MVAITYDKETNSVFQHLGRTEYFYLFDEETDAKKIVDNGGFSHRDLVTYLKSLGVSTLISGGIGSHAVELLASLGIKLIPGAIGDINDVIKSYKAGTWVGNPNAMHACSHGEDHH